MFKKVFFLCLLPVWVFAQQFPEKPRTLLLDKTGTLSRGEFSALENKLLAYNDSTSSQIAVVLISDLGGYPVDQYAFELAEKWGIGKKGKNNGVLILIAKNDRKMTIATGYGLEGALPDAICKRIIERILKPEFRDGRYYAGLNSALDEIFARASGEYVADKREGGRGIPAIYILLICGIIFGLIIFSYSRDVNKYAIANHIPFWTAWALLSQQQQRHSGKWNDFSSGGGSFGGWGGGSSGGSWGGGSSGSDFGGFGGGSFGGGGASGSW